VAGAVGILTDSLDKALTAATSLAEGLVRVGSANPLEKIAGVAGIISGGIGILGSIFGSGESAALIQAEQDNTAALHEVTLGLSKFAPGGDLADIQKFATIMQDALAAGLASGAALGLPGGFDPGAAFKTLLAEGLAAGLSLADLETIAKNFGITLVQDGRLVSDAFTALPPAIQKAILALTTFSDSLDSRSTQADVQQKLLGGDVTDPLFRLKKDAELLAQAVPDFRTSDSRAGPQHGRGAGGVPQDRAADL
jgi:hypothetical protein